MTRRLIALAASIAVLVPLADMAEANHERNRNSGALRIGPLVIGTGSRPFLLVEERNGRVVTRTVARPFPYDTFDNEEAFPFVEDENGLWRYVPGTRTRTRVPERAREKTVKVIPRAAAAPAKRTPPRSGAVEVSLIPVPAPGRTPIIEEAAVIGPADPILPVGEIGKATAEDVATHGPAAFALLSKPQSLGLPELDDGQQYYVLNGKVVTLDAEGVQALTVAALTSALQ